MQHGPNVNRLIAYKFSLLAVPDDGEVERALKKLSSDANRTALMQQAQRWTEDLIAAARNNYPDHFTRDDESLAAILLSSVRAQHHHHATGLGATSTHHRF